jgi:hypothetical protein
MASSFLSGKTVHIEISGYISIILKPKQAGLYKIDMI